MNLLSSGHDASPVPATITATESDTETETETETETAMAVLLVQTVYPGPSTIQSSAWT